jgi:superfamily II DNA helicase RecQ
MCEYKPANEQAFLAISGVGQMKLEKYGTLFIQYFQSNEEKASE